MKLNEQDIRRIFQQRPASGLTSQALTDVALGRAALTETEVAAINQADLAALRLSNELTDWTEALTQELETACARPTLTQRVLGWVAPDGALSLGRVAPLGGAAALALAVAAAIQLSSGPNAISPPVASSSDYSVTQDALAGAEIITRSGFEASAPAQPGDALLFHGGFEDTDALFAAGSFEAVRT